MLWLFAVLVGVLGCPGTISDPARFFRDGVPIVGDAAPADRTPPVDNPSADRVTPPADTPPLDSPPADREPPKGCDIQPLMAKECTLCHNNASPAGSLSLEGTGLFDMLKAKDSTKCVGSKLVDPTNVLQSVFWDKVSNPSPCGGGVMPPTGKMLGASDLDCIKKWLEANASQ